MPTAPPNTHKRPAAAEGACSNVSAARRYATTRKTPAEKLIRKSRYFSKKRPRRCHTPTTPTREASITRNAEARSANIEPKIYHKNSPLSCTKKPRAKAGLLLVVGATGEC